jgi:hypothetical protein
MMLNPSPNSYPAVQELNLLFFCGHTVTPWIVAIIYHYHYGKKRTRRSFTKEFKLVVMAQSYQPKCSVFFGH